MRQSRHYIDLNSYQSLETWRITLYSIEANRMSEGNDFTTPILSKHGIRKSYYAFSYTIYINIKILRACLMSDEVWGE